MSQAYLLLKSFHLIAVISWMAGLLYTYRLFIYHTEYGLTDRSNHTLLSLMELRLLRYITFPAMIAGFASGVLMVLLNQGLLAEHWFHVKATAALGMMAVTLYARTLRLQLKEQKPTRFSSKGLRFLNEVPTLLMIVIVVMAILRPFF
jgi:protoporphyrinogen IX oxidase